MKFYKIGYSVFLFTLFIQIRDYSSSGGFNLYYLIIYPFLFYLIFHKRILSLKIDIFHLFILSLLITTFIAFLNYGVYFDSMRLAFMAGAFFLGKKMYDININIIFEIIALLVLSYSLVRFILLLLGYDFMDYALVAGKHNIEITMFIFLAMLQRKKSIFSALIFLAFVSSFYYLSRIGFILSFISLFLKYFKKINLKKNFLKLNISIILIGVLFIFVKNTSLIEKFLNYDQEIIYKEEGVGRLGLWSNGVTMLNDNIFGYGVGNTVNVMSTKTKSQIKENNIHNIYFQILLDGGIHSFLLFLLFLIKLFKYKYKETDYMFYGYKNIVILYLISGLVQFVGYEVLAWFSMGKMISYQS